MRRCTLLVVFKTAGPNSMGHAFYVPGRCHITQTMITVCMKSGVLVISNERRKMVVCEHRSYFTVLTSSVPRP